MIYRGETITASEADSKHRVKVKIPGIWETTQELPLIESVNGMFLRKGEKVYVSMNDSFDSAIIIGRQGNWFDPNEYVTFVNSLIDHLNDLSNEIRQIKTQFNNHMHTGVYTGGGVSATAMLSGFQLQPTTFPRDLQHIKVDDVIAKNEQARPSVTVKKK